MNKLNGAQRERTKLSGAEWNKNLAADVLIAGWLAGKMGAYALSEDGRFHNALQYGFEAIGIADNYARMALWAVELCKEGQDKLATFKIVMKVVADHVQDCSLPIEACRLKRDAIEPAFTIATESQIVKHEHIA